MTTAIARGSGPKHINIVRNSVEDLVEVGNVCYDVSVVLPIMQVPKTVEMTDKELLSLIDHSKTFDFWNDEEEDIYSISDGTPL